jgi:glycosyltransferase involved in cell wall biosynthesis
MLVEFLIPVYNEEKILEKNIKTLFDFLSAWPSGFDWKITVLNNGSTDASREILRRIGDDKIGSEFIANPGKGGAIKSCACKSQADIIAYMDIDLAVSLDCLPRLLEPIIEGRADIAIGSRLLPDSITERSRLRSLSSIIYNRLSRFILSHGQTDLQCGFKAFSTAKTRSLFSRAEDKGWFFDTELVILALKDGCRIVEIPVSWKENRYEERKSKIKLLSDSGIFVLKLLKLRERLKQAE